MAKKLTLFYRIFSVLITLLFLIIIFVKAWVWSFALEETKEGHGYLIRIYKKDLAPHKFTSQKAGRLFDQIDHLLTPVMMLAFIMLAVKLINSQDIFEEKS